MKIFKDKNVIGLIVILVIFTIGYFLLVNKISYAFSNDYDVEKSYNTILSLIEKSAIKYGEQNLELFDKENIIYIKVQDLIDHNLLIANEDGNIKNPLDKKENMNSNIIKIKYENENFEVEVDS